MPDNYVRIKIAADADTRAFLEAQRRIAELSGKATELTKALEGMHKASSGVSQGLGLGFGQQVFQSLAQIPGYLEGAVQEGIRFNATLESSRLGIAAVMKQFDTEGKLPDFQSALKEAGGAIDLLKQKAVESPATFEQLVSGFQGLSGAFASAGLKMREQVDLVVLMSQALAGLGIRSDQLLQESRALVTGNITEDAMAAQILGITKAQVDSARESGQLFEFLTGKLSAFAEAGSEGAKSYNTQLSNLEDVLTQLKASGTSEFFEELRGALADINKELATENAQQWAAGLGHALGMVIPAAHEAAKAAAGILPGGEGFWNLKNTAIYKAWKPVIDAGRQQKLMDQLKEERTRLRGGLEGAETFEAQNAATEAVQKAIETRQAQAAAADGEQKEALEQQLHILEGILASREKSFEIAQANRDVDTIPGIGTKQTAATAKAAKAEAARDAGDRALDEAIANVGTREFKGPERLADLQRRRADLGDAVAADLFNEHGKIVPGGSEFDVSAAAGAIKAIAGDDAAKKLQERLKAILAIDREMAVEREKEGKALDDQMEKEGEHFKKRRDALAEMRDEQEITLARVNGHEALAKQLEAQRDLHRQIAQLEKDGILDAETKAAAEARANAQIASQGKTRTQNLAAAEADNAVAAAEQGRSKRALREARLNQFAVKKREELKGRDLADADIDRLTAQATDIEERRLRKADHVIGGAAPRSDRDTLGGGISLLDRARESIATPESDDFAKAFGSGTGLADVIPPRPANAPTAGTPASDKGPSPADVAGKVDAMGSQVAHAVAGVGTAVDKAKTTITKALDDLRRRMDSLANEVHNAGGGF